MPHNFIDGWELVPSEWNTGTTKEEDVPDIPTQCVNSLWYYPVSGTDALEKAITEAKEKTEKEIHLSYQVNVLPIKDREYAELKEAFVDTLHALENACKKLKEAGIKTT